jgi:hypothetical protein
MTPDRQVTAVGRERCRKRARTTRSRPGRIRCDRGASRPGWLRTEAAFLDGSIEDRPRGRPRVILLRDEGMWFLPLVDALQRFLVIAHAPAAIT